MSMVEIENKYLNFTAFFVEQKKRYLYINPLSANPQNGQTNCLSVFAHFVGLALKGLIKSFFHCLSVLKIKVKHIT